MITAAVDLAKYVVAQHVGIPRMVAHQLLDNCIGMIGAAHAVISGFFSIDPQNFV